MQGANVPEQRQSFGYWLRRRRKALDLTQEALAQRVCCSTFSIRKIEADERRPSRRLAERLATSLAIPEAERRAFLDVARSVYVERRLRLDAVPVGSDIAAETNLSPAGALGPARDNTPFVGRADEYALLTGLIARLAAQTGHTVLIEGEPGIGKSRLMREVAHHAASLGMPTLASNCYEIERATPYQPVIGLITRALDRAPEGALRNLAPVSLAELAALVPEISERFPDLPRLSKDFPEARQARLSRAVAQILEAASTDRPSLLIVDDIQWADAASAQVLHYLARQAASRPVLVIYAYRDEDADSDERLARLVESMRRDANARHLRLARLEYADTERLVASLADANVGDMAFVERLHRETDGNPFFLTSILQSLLEGESKPELRHGSGSALLPDALRAAVRVRLAQVPEQSRPILQTAAVLGRRFDFDTLVEVTGEPEQQVLSSIERLLRRRLLREEPEGGVYDFSHDKVREVVYRDISGARRRVLHQCVAEAVERRDEPETPERTAQLAEHFERAQLWSRALHYLLLAAEFSQALFSMRDALHWLDRAVALSEAHPESLQQGQDVAIYERRGAARAQAGQTQGAVADFRHSIDALHSTGDRAKIRDVLIQLGMAYRRADSYAEATECLSEALAECRSMNDERRAADTLYHLGTVAWSTGHNDQATVFHQQAVEICQRAGFDDLVAVQAYHGRGEAHYANAEPAEAIVCFTRSLELARSIGDKSYESENLMMIGHACVGAKGLGEYARATANFEAALEIAHAADLQWHLGPTLLGFDHVRACTGSYGAAWTGMQATLRWLEGLSQVRYQLIAYDFIGTLLLDLDLNELAIEQLQRGLALGRDTGIMFWAAAIEAGYAVARARLGHRDAAPSLHRTLDRARRASEQTMQVRCIDALAEISLAAGDAAGCLAFADELLAIAVRNGLRELEAGARRWRGAALLANGNCAEAEQQLTLAAEMAASIGRVRLRLDAETALAQLHRRRRQIGAARLHADQADQIARAIEASVVSSGLEARLARAVAHH